MSEYDQLIEDLRAANREWEAAVDAYAAVQGSVQEAEKRVNQAKLSRVACLEKIQEAAKA